LPCPSDHFIPILDELQARVGREALSASSENPTGENQRRSVAPKTGRGGRRPGAGAPKGNLNALKHGLRSEQFAAVGRLLAQDPTVRDALLRIAGRYDLERARANEMAALLFTMLFERARQLSGGRLNDPTPADDWRSVKAAARFLSGGKHGADPEIAHPPPHNQTPDTAADNQSDGIAPSAPRSG
jgi:hypothetical protein